MCVLVPTHTCACAHVLKTDLLEKEKLKGELHRETDRLVTLESKHQDVVKEVRR